MSKQLYSPRFILKIQSDKLKDNDWSLNINLQEARDNEELIQLGDSQILRFIRELTNMNYSELEIEEVKNKINKLKKEKSCKANKEQIKKLYKELDKMLYIEDYVSIIFNKKGDFDRATNRKGFTINGKKFKRIVGTTGGVKQNTVNFCSEKIYDKLNEKLDCGRNKDTPIVPAKLEAYRALSASVSTPVTQTRRILVIKDGITNIKDKVIKVSDNGDDYKVEYNADYETEKEFCDGCAMIRPELSEQWAIDLGLYHKDKDGNKIANYIPSGFNTRFAFEKGMLCTYDFELFGKEIANNYIVKDTWGQEHDIRDIDIIFTTNMLKLWNAYDNIDDYLDNCEKYGYLLSVTKVTPKKLETKRNMNYQYLQSYDFTDEDIKELCFETVNNIDSVLGLDIAKTILFSKGIDITKDNVSKGGYDFIQALTIDSKVLEDSYVKNKIYNMIEKRIREAKKGVIQVDGCYSIICGDLFALCQSMFGLKITGLLKKGEFYSKTWTDKGVNEIVSYRSPMTSHNNISKKKLINNELTNKWFKYINTMTIFNAWDTTCDSMNGADYDSDAEIETNNPVILRTTRKESPIICEQKSTPKIKVTEKKLRLSNKNGFGNAVGSITNRVTTMFDVLASLDKNSDEYNELMRRIICGQALQQEEIDKIKGIQAKQMPKHWYDYKVNKISDKDNEEIKKQKEFNLKLVVNKKPYFFIYNYKNIQSKYNMFMKNIENNCIVRFGLGLKELKNKIDKTQEELKFLKSAKYRSPVFDNPSAMNKICWYIEDVFKDIKLRVNKDEENFNKNIYMTCSKKYESKKEDIEKLFKEYKNAQKQYMIEKGKLANKEENKCKREEFVNNFKQKAIDIYSNNEDLCNAIISTLYDTKANRQFVWDICGEQMITNLLNNNDNKYKYPVKCKDGDIEWNGLRFRMEECQC